MDSDTNWVVLAHLLRPQGRKGELLAELLTDFPERFDDGCRVFLAKEGFHGTASEARAAEVTGYWLPVGKNQGRVVLKLSGVDSINDAELLSRLDVLVPREQRVALEEEDSNYISDLIGCTVYDAGDPIGVIDDVQFATTPDGLRRLEERAPMLVLSSDNGEELLVPFAKDFLVKIDAQAKRVDMKLPIGLLDVNR
jgi:16S rRNA processing protein RimM